jgi:hypothetical protein
MAWEKRLSAVRDGSEQSTKRMWYLPATQLMEMKRALPKQL